MNRDFLNFHERNSVPKKSHPILGKVAVGLSLTAVGFGAAGIVYGVKTLTPHIASMNQSSVETNNNHSCTDAKQPDHTIKLKGAKAALEIVEMDVPRTDTSGPRPGYLCVRLVNTANSDESRDLSLMVKPDNEPASTDIGKYREYAGWLTILGGQAGVIEGIATPIGSTDQVTESIQISYELTGKNGIIDTTNPVFTKISPLPEATPQV